MTEHHRPKDAHYSLNVFIQLLTMYSDTALNTVLTTM